MSSIDDTRAESSIGDIGSWSSIDDMRLRTPRELGAAIKDRRIQLRLGQGALAEKVGVSRQWVVAVEGGKPRADMGLVLRTLEALGLRLDVVASDAAATTPATPNAGLPPIAAPDLDAIIDAARRERPPPAPDPSPAKPARKRRRRPGPRR
jgi:HTH-type transcriptional regulator/antitoxin HipB